MATSSIILGSVILGGISAYRTKQVIGLKLIQREKGELLLKIETCSFFGKIRQRLVRLQDILSTNSSTSNSISFKVRGDILFYVLDKPGSFIRQEELDSLLAGNLISVPKLLKSLEPLENISIDKR